MTVAPPPSRPAVARLQDVRLRYGRTEALRGAPDRVKSR